MKFSLDWLKDLLGKEEYLLFRDEKVQLYINYTERRYNFVIQQLQIVKFLNAIEDDHKRVSILKSLTMKLIQLILVRYSKCCYIKEEMAFAINRLIPDTVESAKYLLFRGKEGVWDEISISSFYQLLVTAVETIIIEQNAKLQWNHFSLALWPNPTKLPDLI